MKLLFDHRMIKHINENSIAERGYTPRLMLFAERIFQSPVFVVLLGVFEKVVSTMLNLPIPFFRGLVYVWVTHSIGLPKFFGNYLRALYYRPQLGGMEPNVFIDQGVFFAFPAGVHLS